MAYNSKIRVYLLYCTLSFANINMISINIPVYLPTRLSSSVEHQAGRERFITILQRSRFTLTPDVIMQVLADMVATTPYISPNRPAAS